MIRYTDRKIGSAYPRLEQAPEVVVGYSDTGPVIIVKGGQRRRAEGLSFADRAMVEALRDDLNEALARWPG